ncbi:uncharacterized protein LDX57_012682 [Aspergillus melleus]|uniref:uncharacterized protein n=1 Tax=Aspergillus melleus TaxID=138277 RepID=UPI001E8CEC21|nr:uncharacterized protein LDX57_012682 [Aspergillus melleus]KAH8435053.1 hypothetical protein LDX57_012682 [Aspergillus melleus]
MSFALPDHIAEQMPKDGHYWLIDEGEAARLSELLDVEWSSLPIDGFIFDGPKPRCFRCGKLGGFDDLVAAALRRGIHTQSFIVEALVAGRDSLPHDDVDCSHCGTQWLQAPKWVTRSGWLIWKEPELRTRHRHGQNMHGVELPGQESNAEERFGLAGQGCFSHSQPNW